MIRESLLNISPVDGRYVEKTNVLSSYFSEFGLIQKRVLVEIEYFIALCELNLSGLESFPKKLYPELQKIYLEFSLDEAKRVKEIEKKTNHDVKSVEYFIKEKFDALNLSDYKEYIHFGLTSQDINNTAYPLCIKDATKNVLIPELSSLLKKLEDIRNENTHIPMLAHTHGQPASPTRLGKEIGVFSERLSLQLEKLKKIPFSGKFGGATGNFNAHVVAYPSINWIHFSNTFLLEKLGINRQQTTTQIEHYDDLAELCQQFIRINTILIDLCRDIWTYISMDYFKQKINPNEVGSSAMPHKVNPIDFENAEGNFGVANSIFSFLAEKLPISRLQRDLTDSTVLRNIGTPFAHSFIAYNSILKGLNKLIINEPAISKDLDNNWAVVAEAIQTFLRSKNYPNPYEKLKELTRNNQHIDQLVIHQFIDSLSISLDDKEYLKKISPHNYLGVF